jgi:16S rRNA (guanine966-N2)-methyltransferase
MAARKERQLRIIGGQWRGRKLDFPDVDAIRPTPNRVRETLFNWLQGTIIDSHCLDLFAGSGALALEALSRGAASVIMVEKDNAAVQQLHAHLNTLGANQQPPRAQIIHADALAYLRRIPEQTFDVVFLDPPFTQDFLRPCIELLEQHAWLAGNAWVYLEVEKGHKELNLPDNWSLHRSKTTGNVTSHLVKRHASCDDAP